jgi:hypothetical protein
MSIANDPILDLLNSTRYEENDGRFTFLDPDDVEYIAFQMLQNRKMVKPQTGGKGVEHSIVTENGSTSSWIDPWSKDNINVTDVLYKITMDWYHLTDNCSWVRHELNQNSGKYQIQDILNIRRLGCRMNMIKAYEEAFWGVPDAAETLRMPGLFYWLVPNATTGFNGGLPNYTGAGADYADMAGLSLTSVPKFQNYTATYSAVSKADLIDKMRMAHKLTGWKSPISGKGFSKETGSRRTVFCSFGVLQQAETLLEDQNENLGNDLASKDGRAIILRHPWVGVPAFEDYPDDASHELKNPVAMVDLDTFKVYYDTRNYFYKTKAERNPDNHNQYDEFYDLSVLTLCHNRRANAIFTYDA